PFRYLADDYGLTYYAAFSGCSAETEASFGTLAFLAGKVDELSLPVVLVIETSDQSVARSVIANTQAKNQEILVMDSLQSVTLSRVNAGETYLGIMEQNCSVLEKALH
ncbi:MAG: zinc ABC transporter substrate-binding protein, partial [Clostridiales bacterium]